MVCIRIGVEGDMERLGTRDAPTSGEVWVIVLHDLTAQLSTGVFSEGLHIQQAQHE